MKKISLKSIKTEELLSREELKQIMGGSGGSGCGTNISCSGKRDGEYCGTRSCTCAYVSGGGNMLYCRSDY